MKYLYAGLSLFFVTFIAMTIKGSFNNYFLAGLIFSALLILMQLKMSFPYFKRLYYSGGLSIIYERVIIVFIILLFHLFLRNHDFKKDFTLTRKNSLIPKTISVLSGLQKEAHLTLFMKKELISEQIRALLQLYDNASPRFNYSFIDPDIEPGKAEKWGVKQYNTLILTHGKRKEILRRFSEEHLTSALIRLTSKKTPLVLFTSGSGEKSIENQDDQGLSMFAGALNMEGINTDTFVCGLGNEVLKECDLLIIAGPSKELVSRGEIIKYMADKGSALILAEPHPAPSLNKLVQDFGLVVSDTIVIDKKSMIAGGDYFMPVAREYPPHDITADIQGRPAFFSMARAVFKRSSRIKGFKLNDLVYTSKDTWAETSWNLDQKVNFDKDLDFEGPLALAIIAENENQCIALFGDSDFISNKFFLRAGNHDISINTVNYILGRTKLVAMSKVKDKYRGLVLGNTQRTVIFAVKAFVVILLGAIGVVVSRVRRV